MTTTLLLCLVLMAIVFTGTNNARRTPATQIVLEDAEKQEIRRVRDEQDPVKAIRTLRENHPGLGLAEAKRIVDGL